MDIVDSAWQARFYDHIIWIEKELENIHSYILGNIKMGKRRILFEFFQRRLFFPGNVKNIIPSVHILSDKGAAMHNIQRFPLIFVILLFSFGISPVNAQTDGTPAEMNIAKPRFVVFEGFYNPA